MPGGGDGKAHHWSAKQTGSGGLTEGVIVRSNFGCFFDFRLSQNQPTR